MPTSPNTPSEVLAEAERRIAECHDIRDRSLDLSRLDLHELPESVRTLSWITSLYIQGNYLTSIPTWLSELTQLRNLHAQDNPLNSVPASLGHLSQLQSLYLGSNTSLVLPDDLGQLQELSSLTLPKLGLTQVPDWLRKLQKLEILRLYYNQLTTLPKWMGELTQLKNLDASYNKLRELPASLLELKALKTLDLAGNPELGVPIEILKTVRADRILDYYFRSTSSGASKPPKDFNTIGVKDGNTEEPHAAKAVLLGTLNEFKLVLVGRGGVGKTTLVHRLVTDNYKEFKRTPGVNITQWPTTIGGESVRAHVWDFGGQEIMHGTHRFFMTERALYLVLLSGREGTEDHDAEYWLSMVRSFAGDVPVIVLLNKWSDYRFELNQELLREKYGRNLVFVETDSETGHGIAELRKQMSQLATRLPGLRAAWPVAWRRVKDELPQQKKNWMTFDDFLTFCTEREVVDRKDQEYLAESLHDLGLMLYYRKDETLRDFGVLNPQWVTKGIYEMLNAPALRSAGGKFTVKTFSEVLSEEEYPKELHPYLLALMRKFRLCHPLDDKGEKYLIPELLTKEEPKIEAEFPPDKCIGFIYHYGSVLPEGLLPRFIVETYVHREPKHAWRTGVVLERANCRALVRGDVQGRTITIRVAGIGNGRRELLGIIREHFERIHRSYEKLSVTERVPIPGHADAQVKYELLLKYERANQPTILVEVDDGLSPFSVKELLDGVDLPGAPRAEPAGTKGVRVPEGMGLSALSVFISYAHKDETFLDQLRAALVPYERKGELEVWADKLVEPGQNWEDETLTRLHRARLIILLLSPDFVSTSRCMDQELPRAMQRHEQGECEIVPIVIRAGRYDKLDLGTIEAIMPSGKPIKAHKDKDSAWQEVTRRLDVAIARLQKSR